MQTVQHVGLECVALENKALSLLVTRSVGPRIISLRLAGGDNLLVEIPDFSYDGSVFGKYHFYGGHRLWHAPEHPDRTYIPDDADVDITQLEDGLVATQQIEEPTGIQKAMHIRLPDASPKVIVEHAMTNKGQWPVACALWAITQLRPGGVGILPQSSQPTGLTPNRALALWPYTNINSPHIRWGNQCIMVTAQLKDEALKIGFPNPRGWLAYWLAGMLFVKKATFDPAAAYYDLGSSSSCYCNDHFLELETVGPIVSIAPGQTVTHTEIWELFSSVDLPADEASAQALAERLGLEK